MKYRGFGVFALVTLILTIGYARMGTVTKQPVRPKIPAAQSAEAGPEKFETQTFPAVVSDALGHDVMLPSPPIRIVSLAPSATELLFDIGAGDKVVADTTADDYPTQAVTLPHIGGAFDMSLEKIVAQKPDLVVADGTVNNKRLLVALQDSSTKLLVIMPTDLESSYESIRMLGRATGSTRGAADLINNLKDSFAKLRAVQKKSFSVRKVLVLYDTSTLYTSGPKTLIDDIIKIAGGKNIATSNDPLESEWVIQQQPDVIICSPSLQPKIVQMPAWKGTVPAVINTAFFSPSIGKTLIRPGRRLAAGAEELARFIHPELYLSDGKPAPFVAPLPAKAPSK